MLFTIIVPIYNTEQYLKKCVESLISQTYENIEIILVDDESPDNAPQMCDEYAVLDSRVIVIHKKNGGLSDARNAGLRIARGNYIMFVDSDDYIETTACERIAVLAEQYSPDIIIGDAVVEGGKCTIGHIAFSGSITGEEYMLRAYREHKSPMAAWLNVYKREFLIDNGLKFKYGILHEDEQFTPRAFLKAQSVVYSAVTFYHYILRQNSITTKKDKRKNAVDVYNTLLELKDLYNRIEDYELRRRLINSLSDNYLDMFYVGKLYQYGKDYLHKNFVRTNALLMRTKLKAYLYVFSPRVYYCINKTKHILLELINV